MFELPVPASSTFPATMTATVPLVGLGVALTFDTTGGTLSTLNVAQALAAAKELVLPAKSVPCTHTVWLPLASVATVAAAIVAFTSSVASSNDPSEAVRAMPAPPSRLYAASVMSELPVPASSTLPVTLTATVPLVGLGVAATPLTTGG